MDSYNSYSIVDTVNMMVSAFFDKSGYESFRSGIIKLLGISKNDYSPIGCLLDESYSGLPGRIKKDFPELSVADYRLLLLFLVGLSYQTVRLLTNETKSNLYSKKNRFVRKIGASDSGDRTLLLSLLDKRRSKSCKFIANHV